MTDKRDGGDENRDDLTGVMQLVVPKTPRPPETPSYEELLERVARLGHRPLAGVEQPLPPIRESWRRGRGATSRRATRIRS